METYDNPTCCDHAPAPPPVEVYEPAPLPAYVPPVPAPPAAEIFPEVSAPAAAPVVEAPLPQPLPEPVQPLAPAPLSSGTLLGPSVVGGTADLGGSGFVGGAPDLGASTTVGGSFAADLGASTTVGGSWAPDLGGTWIDRDNGTPLAAPGSPVATGSFGAAAANMVNANNAALAGGLLSGDWSSPYPAPWTHGYNSDRDGVLNQHDPDPRDRFV